MTEYTWPEAARNDKAFGSRITNRDDVHRLEQTILNATYLMQHTPDFEAKMKYRLIIKTAAEDYYVATGGWFHTSSLQKTNIGGSK